MRTFPKELAAFRVLVDERGAELRSMSYDDLLALADRPTEDIRVEGRPATVTVIVEQRNDAALRIVIQGFMPSRIRLLGSSVALDGFYKLRDGAIEPMTVRELREFD